MKKWLVFDEELHAVGETEEVEADTASGAARAWLGQLGPDVQDQVATGFLVLELRIGDKWFKVSGRTETTIDVEEFSRNKLVEHQE